VLGIYFSRKGLTAKTLDPYSFLGQCLLHLLRLVLLGIFCGVERSEAIPEKVGSGLD
jgi:hypothetical protein